jgi:L-lactate dehydrogenase complex protein LldG
MTKITPARDAILGALAALSAQLVRTPEMIAAGARELLLEPEVVRPELPLADVAESFMQRVTGPKVGATVQRIATMADLPTAVARHLSSCGLASHVAVQPCALLQALDWAGAGLVKRNEIDDGTAIGLALWGIAETGSLVFHSAPDMPILLNFLPSTHIVALPASCIVPDLETYAAAARICGDPAPRNACLITGASGTTDIEGSLVKPAHGPRELHIIVVDHIEARDAVQT